MVIGFGVLMLTLCLMGFKKNVFKFLAEVGTFYMIIATLIVLAL